MMNDILITLQEHTAHQEEEIARLSEELHTQQGEIIALRKHLEQLESRLNKSEQNDDGYGGEAHAPPPHY